MLTLRGPGGDSVVIDPDHGGAIVGWSLDRGNLLRHALPAAVVGGNPHAMGCFPLVPYGNRIAEGRFSWTGRDYQISRNFGDHPHAIHGIGWQRPWRTEAVSACSMRLSLVHAAVGEQARAWPFAFVAELSYTLRDDALVVTLSATNLHDAPAPMGIGLHPYLPRTFDAVLRFDASGVWINDQDSLPHRHGPIPGAWDHAKGLPVASQFLDNCFTGWTKAAHLDAAAGHLQVTASGSFNNLQVFTPPWADFYCVEPVSHVPDAINRPGLSRDQAMGVLASGEIITGTIEFRRLG
jgi:aldose 1-epimerase